MIAIENYYSLVTAEGKDCVDYINRMMTIDIDSMSVNTAALGAQLAANGRVIAPILFIRLEQHLGMLLHPTLADTVVTELNRFRFRSKVEFNTHEYFRFFALQQRDQLHNDAAQFAVTARVTSDADGHTLDFADGRKLLVSSDEKLTSVAADNAWQIEDIKNGICWPGAAASDRYIPQMLGFESLGAIDFRKGCFPGQEVVARIRYKGRVKRHLYRCHASAALECGDTLSQDNRSLGEIVTACDTADGTIGLAVLKESVCLDDDVWHDSSGSVLQALEPVTALHRDNKSVNFQ